MSIKVERVDSRGVIRVREVKENRGGEGAVQEWLENVGH